MADDGISAYSGDEMPIKIGQRPDHTFEQPLGLLSDCHRRIEFFLQVLIATDERVAGGPLDSADRASLEGALAYFASAAPRHTADEEDSLFPRLRQCADPAAGQALATLAVLEADHAEADGHHRAVDQLVRRWMTAGSLDAADRGVLRDRLSRLREMYSRHIDVEDRELFPAAARLLTKMQVQEIGREMAARRARPRP